MRKEALLEQWKQLYEVATRIKELKPWEKLWDMDLIAVRSGAKEDTVFYSILGRDGDCYGIAVYEGYEGLNSFLMLPMQQSMNLKPEYVMFNQKNLTCYWGNREELTGKQRKLIKDLGYSYRGKNQWLYFLSFEPGYYPYNMDESEVLRMSTYLQDLELALRYYNETDIKVDFEHGNMFLFSFGKDKKTWNFGEAPLPFTSFQFGNLLITDEELLSDLAKAPKCDAVLEADVSVLLKTHFYKVKGVNLHPIHDLKKLIAIAKNTKKYAWLVEYDCMALQESVRNLNKAYGRFFKKEAGYPRFKSIWITKSSTAIRSTT